MLRVRIYKFFDRNIKNNGCFILANSTIMNSTAMSKVRSSKLKQILTPQNQKEPLNISIAGMLIFFYLHQL